MAKLYNLARMTTATTGTGTITLGSAKAGYLSFSGAGIADGDVIAYGITDGSNSEVGTGVYTASGTTLTRNVRRSTNSNSAISLSGSAEVFITAGAEDLLFMARPGGRLTLTTATPVMTSTASGQTTIYYTPYLHRMVPLWTGSHFQNHDVGAELTNSTTASSVGSAGPAAVTTNSNYDLFVWLDGTTYRLTRGPAWQTSTARHSGSASEIERVQGLWVNKYAITNGPAARYGTYVGTVRSNGSSQIDYILGGTSAGGTAAVIGVWNMYNRVQVCPIVNDSTASWSYNSTTVRAMNASNGNRISMLRGLNEDGVQATLSVPFSGGTAGDYIPGIALDATASITFGNYGSFGSFTGPAAVAYGGMPGLGFHYLQCVEKQFVTTDAATIFGVVSSTQVHSFAASMMA